MRFFAIASALLLLISCSDQQPKITNLRVNHYQQTGVGAGPQLVYLVQEREDIGTEKWKFFYPPITGFEYELGYIYNLKVRKEKIENPPADGSSVNYMLEEVISKEKVANGISFSVRLKPTGYNNKPDFITGDKTNEFTLLHAIDIQCNNLCQQLAKELQTAEALTGTFQHVNSSTIKLIQLEQ
ncbi:MAG: DUF4377 domain-containing protein [Balneolaceae bacterium]|nr:DUF4377 domain-containing protein [Balneolaceae bacterium]